MSTQKLSTLVVHAGQYPDLQTGAVNVPLYLSSTFELTGIGTDKGWDYSRAGNPTRDRLEEALAALEGGTSGHAFASAHLTCRPTGVQGITSPKEAVLVMQTPEELIFIAQEDREVRRIWLNSDHPKDLRPSYSGDAIGHWEGNTLVVDVVGFNGKVQLD